MRVCEKVFGSDLTLSTLLFPYSDLLHRLSHSQYLKRFLWLLWQVLLWFPPFLRLSPPKSLLSFPLKFLCLLLLSCLLSRLPLQFLLSFSFQQRVYLSASSFLSSVSSSSSVSSVFFFSTTGLFFLKMLIILVKVLSLFGDSSSDFPSAPSSFSSFSSFSIFFISKRPFIRDKVPAFFFSPVFSSVISVISFCLQ